MPKNEKPKNAIYSPLFWIVFGMAIMLLLVGLSSLRENKKDTLEVSPITYGQVGKWLFFKDQNVLNIDLIKCIELERTKTFVKYECNGPYTTLEVSDEFDASNAQDVTVTIISTKDFEYNYCFWVGINDYHVKNGLHSVEQPIFYDDSVSFAGGYHKVMVPDSALGSYKLLQAYGLGVLPNPSNPITFEVVRESPEFHTGHGWRGGLTQEQTEFIDLNVTWFDCNEVIG